MAFLWVNMKTENKSALVHKYALSFMQQPLFSKKAG
jgi:hypothetical protein